MSTIVTRVGKGSPLTWTEVDSNFTNLNTDKLQSGNTASSLTITSATINGGSINGTTVGASTASSGAFTSITDSGNLTFTGTGNRIIGDFTNSTFSSRTLFQTNAANSSTAIGAIPNGTSNQSVVQSFGGSDPDNSQRTSIITIGGSDSRIVSTYSGTPTSGTYVPMTFLTGGSERMRIDTSGNVGIGTSTPLVRLHIKAAASTFVNFAQENTNGGTDAKIVDWINNGNGYSLRLLNDAYNAANTAYSVDRSGYTVNYQAWYTGSGTERMRIDSSGNVGIGTASPDANLTVNGAASFAAGTALLPSIARAGDLNTGIFFPAADTIAFSEGGAEAMRIHSSGGVSIGNTTDSGLASLNVSGSMSGGYIAHANGTTAMAFGTDNVARVTPTATASYTTTVPAAGAICVLSILTSGATSYTITFSTGFKSTGTLATGTTTARYFNITFVSDGTNLIEMSRTTAIT
jgi:hypothetical protein